MTITVDRDQSGWRSSKIYADGALAGLWVPDKVVIHWGGSTIPPSTRAGERSLLRGWQRYHLGKGWRDIAYNYSVGNNAPLVSRRSAADRYRLRGWNPGGATSGDFEGDGIRENAEAVAVVWTGGSGGKIKPAAFEAMAIIVSEILAEIGADEDLVIGHRDVKGTTTCPGDEWMEWIRARGWTTAPPPPPPGADEEDWMTWLTALQRQDEDYFVSLAAQTGSPGGSDPGYWGRSHNSDGVRVGPMPNDLEWSNALDELAAASLTSGVMHPAGAPQPPKAHDHDGTYSKLGHPHTVPGQTIT